MPAPRNIALNDGHSIPQLGYGVWQVDNDVAEDVVGQALRAGYRHIDTAAAYGNERGVGRAIARAADEGIARDDVFVTSKLANPDHGYDNALRAFDATMDRLGLDVLDLYLIHWPTPTRGSYVDTFKAFIELHKQGRIRSIGVSNFTAEYLQRVIDETGVTPAVNQIEIHPQFAQPAMREFHRERGIVTEAWSPLGRNYPVWQHDTVGTPALDDPAIADVAARHDASPAQVILAWHLALGNVVFPKSVTPSRIVENFASLDVTLTDDDMAVIDGLDRGLRIGGDPEKVEE